MQPIILTFYDENDEVIKTYKRKRISWSFFTKAIETRLPTDEEVSLENLSTIQEFICNFYDNQFTVEELIKHTDISECLMVGIQIILMVSEFTKAQGIKLPNQQATAEN